MLLNDALLSENISPIKKSNNKLECGFEIRRFLNQQDDLLSIGKFILENGNINFYQNEWKSGINGYQENLLIDESDLKVTKDGDLVGYFPVYPSFGSGLIKLLFLNESNNVINFQKSLPNQSIWEIDYNKKIALIVSYCKNLNKNKVLNSEIIENNNEIKIENQINNENLESKTENKQISSIFNLTCNFSLIRNLMNENDINEIARGKFKIHNGKIIFTNEEWRTGGNINNKNILEISNLNLDKNGFLIGSLPIYTMFGNDEVRVLDVKKKVISDQKWIAGTYDLGIIENHIKILLKPENCKK